MKKFVGFIFKLSFFPGLPGFHPSAAQGIRFSSTGFYWPLPGQQFAQKNAAAGDDHCEKRDQTGHESTRGRLRQRGIHHGSLPERLETEGKCTPSISSPVCWYNCAVN